MLNNKIFKIAAELKTEMKAQQKAALEGLAALPDGATKESLKRLLSKAGSGEYSIADMQREVNKIIQDAS